MNNQEYEVQGTSNQNADNTQANNYGTIQDEQLSVRSNLKSSGMSSSIVSYTDTLPKVALFPSTINIIKAFLCIGILAAPYGFKTVGYLPAILLIGIFGLLNAFTVHLQQRIKQFHGNKVKTYTDMGKVSFGFWGYMAVVLTIIVNQMLNCVSYLLFFYQQMDSVFQSLFNSQTEYKFWIFIGSIVILVPLGFLQSMQHISYISMVAIASICIALVYIIFLDLLEISNPVFDKTYTFVNFSGIPYFFGIASFMFEGNALALEIYQQMDNPTTSFTKALGDALSFTTLTILIIGSLSYTAYAQYTSSIILLNLNPGLLTFIVQTFYCVGLLCSYCIQIVPTFKILKLIPLYANIPESTRMPILKPFITRVFIMLFCGTLAYCIPDISQLLNFQGALTGVLMTFVWPITCYFKTYGDKVTYFERVLCYFTLVFGFVGGATSIVYSLYVLLK